MGRGISPAMMPALVGTGGCSTGVRRDGVGLEDILFVDRKRRECPHISWQTLADMTQRNVHDLRMKCDAGYRAAHGQCGGGSARVETIAVDHGGRLGGGSGHVVRRLGARANAASCRARLLAAVAGGAETSAAVARTLGWNVYQATALLYQLHEEGKLARTLPAGQRKGYRYRLTADGRAWLADAEARGHG